MMRGQDAGPLVASRVWPIFARQRLLLVSAVVRLRHRKKKRERERENESKGRYDAKEQQLAVGVCWGLVEGCLLGPWPVVAAANA